MTKLAKRLTISPDQRIQKTRGSPPTAEAKRSRSTLRMMPGDLRAPGAFLTAKPPLGRRHYLAPPIEAGSPGAELTAGRAGVTARRDPQLSLSHRERTQFERFNHDPTARLRSPGHRRVLPGASGHWLLGGAAREGAELRLLPGQPRRGLVRGRCEPVRLEYRKRASGGPRRYRSRERARGGPLRMARVSHPLVAGLALRAVLPAERGLHDARVPGTPVQLRLAHLLHLGVDRRLRAYQDQRHAVRRRHRDARSDRARGVDERDDSHPRHRPLPRARRVARRHLHRGAPSDRVDRWL